MQRRMIGGSTECDRLIGGLRGELNTQALVIPDTLSIQAKDPQRQSQQDDEQ